MKSTRPWPSSSHAMLATCTSLDGATRYNHALAIKIDCMPGGMNVNGATKGD